MTSKLIVNSIRHTGASADAITLNSAGNVEFPNDHIFSSHAIIVDEKTSGTQSGTFTSGSFQQRDLNTKLSDPDSIVTLSSNDFTLQAGSYVVHASAPAYKVNHHQCLLRNHTDSTNIQLGSAVYGGTGESVQSISFVSARFTLSGAKALRITHKCSDTRSTNGYGINTGFSNSTFTIVEIFKEA